MEFGSVTRARSNKLNETVVVYASVRKSGFVYRFSYCRERKEKLCASTTLLFCFAVTGWEPNNSPQFTLRPSA